MISARTFRGGIHPLHSSGEGKRLTAALPVEPMTAPKTVCIPMAQHIGAPCQPLVKVGDRVTVGQEPACVKTCPTGAIHFGSKEEMKTLAGERVAELKTRGYDNAGLYDPAGVGGTHVMYVLHHADKPNLYHGLPENPEISATVKFWKGIWKPLAAVGFAATFAASIFHYVGVGPNRAEEEEDNLHEEKDEVRK